MTPEAKTVVQKLLDALSKNTGLDSSHAQKIKTRASQALTENKFDIAARETESLKNLSSLPEQLQKFGAELQKVLKDCGVADVDIPWSDLTGKETPIQVVEKVMIAPRESRSKDRRYKSENAGFVALNGLIMQDDEGGFLHSNLGSIADTLLLPDRRDRKDIDLAKNIITVARDLQIKAITKETERTGAMTVEDLYMTHFTDTRGEKQVYYQYAIEKYGHLSPQDFIKVLRRPMELTPRTGKPPEVKKKD